MAADRGHDELLATVGQRATRQADAHGRRRQRASDGVDVALDESGRVGAGRGRGVAELADNLGVEDVIGRTEQKLLRRRHQRARADERDGEARRVRGAEVDELQLERPRDAQPRHRLTDEAAAHAEHDDAALDAAGVQLRQHVADERQLAHHRQAFWLDAVEHAGPRGERDDRERDVTARNWWRRLRKIEGDRRGGACDNAAHLRHRAVALLQAGGEVGGGGAGGGGEVGEADRVRGGHATVLRD